MARTRKFHLLNSALRRCFFANADPYRADRLIEWIVAMHDSASGTKRAFHDRVPMSAFGG